MEESKSPQSYFSSFLFKIIKEMTRLDAVGKKPALLIGSHNRNKTFLGGILSFLILVLILIGFLYFGQEIIYKQIPSEVLSSVIDDGTKHIIIDKDNFNFLFTLKDKNENFISLDSEYLDIKINLVKLSKNNSKIGDENFNLNLKEKEAIEIKKVNLDFIDCDKIYVNSNNNNNLTSNIDTNSNINRTTTFEQLVNSLNKKQYKCLANSAEIYGSTETKELSYLEIQISQCLDLFEYLAAYTGQDLKTVSGIILNSKTNIFENNISNVYNTNISNNNNPKINTSELKKLFKINTNDNNFEDILSSRIICPFQAFLNFPQNFTAEISNKNSSYNLNKKLINKRLHFYIQIH